jgi:hypothetical protein
MTFDLSFDFETILAFALLTAASYGFGSTAIRLVRSEIFSSDLFSILIGASLIIGVGGWLSFFGLYSRWVVVTLLLAGSTLALLGAVTSVVSTMQTYRDKQQAARMPSLSFFAGVASFSALAFVVLRNSAYSWFNGHDDMEAYLAFAEKLSQTGSIGDDPFSRRRLVSGWGGQTVLDATFLGVGPVDGLKAVDMSMGLLAFALIIFYWARHSWLKRLGASALVIVLAFYWLPGANITSHYFAMASITAIAFFIHKAGRSLSKRDWFMFAIIFGTALTLKNTVTTFLLLLVPLLLFLLAKHYRPGLFRGLALVIPVLIVTILPFAVSLFVSSGTFQYPFFGVGYQSQHLSFTASDTGPNLLAQSVEFAKAPFRTPVFLLALGLSAMGVLSRKQAPRYRVFYLSIAGLLSLFVPFLAASGAFDAARYATVVMLPLLLAAIITLDWGARTNGAIAIGTLAAIVGMSTSIHLSFNPQLPFKVGMQETPDWLTDGKYTEERERVARAQDKLPNGATVLVNGPTAYLWDFQRNQILIGDLPGSSSPPPGLPLYSSASEASSYLAEQGVDYLVIDYQGHFDYEIHSSELEEGRPSLWREDFRNQFRYYELVWEIQSVCQADEGVSYPLYDDGKTLVVRVSCG